ncbi:hypothetical protein NL393_35990, partial [Klebsiella pneumoniae]|nr:hypothetical protein [Klebsiella pneumoniae]
MEERAESRRSNFDEAAHKKGQGVVTMMKGSQLTGAEDDDVELPTACCVETMSAAIGSEGYSDIGV